MNNIRTKLAEEFYGTNYFHRICLEIRFITQKLDKFLCAVDCNFLAHVELYLYGH